MDQMLSFLKGGGLASEHIRDFNWELSAIGEPNAWPQSLKSSLSITLRQTTPTILCWDHNQYFFYNDAFISCFAAEELSFNFKSHPEGLPDALWKKLSNAIRSSFEHGTAGVFDHSFSQRGDLSEVNCVVNLVPVENENNEIGGVIVNFTVFSDQAAVSAQPYHRLSGLISNQSEAKFRSMIMQVPMGICIVQKGTNLIELVNDYFLELAGRKRNQMEGKPFWEVVSEAEPVYGPILKQVFDSGISFKGTEHKLALIRSGVMEDVFVSFVYEPMINDDDEVTRVMVVAVDVTPQVIARTKIESTANEVRSLVESAPFPIGVYVGKEMMIQFANKAILDVWGKGYDVIGKKYAEVLPELDNQEIFEQLDEVFTSGIGFHAKNQRVQLLTNGTLKTFYFNYSFTPVYDALGKIYGVMNTAADVTDFNMAFLKIEESEALLQTRVEERTRELLKANEELATMNQELEQFTYAASHDMQEPLRKVQTFSSFLIKNNHQLDEKGKLYLSKIDSSVNRMRTIIEDLLQYSHQTRADQDFETVDLNDVLLQIESDLELDIQLKNALVVKDILPMITAVRAQMNQLFFNLFTNALKFSKPDQPLEINIRLSEPTIEDLKERDITDPAGHIQITFTDNGIGFQQQYAEQIFKLFTRLHGKSEYKGTGIGLGLCKKVIQHHKGAIWARSEQDKGTSFHIILPRVLKIEDN